MTVQWGDTKLADRVRPLLGEKHPVAAVALIDQEELRTTGWGAGPESDFEIGSISKGVTGLLYHDALDRGLVRPQTLLGEVLPLAQDSAAARIDLNSLCSHRSGLPRLAPSRHPLQRNLRLWLRGTNPYGDTLDDLIRQAAALSLDAPRPEYSNIGYELLGHALARAQDTTYAWLLADRISAPLGLTSWYAPAQATDLRPHSLTGRTKHGRARHAWTGEALAPAGGIRSTIADMATFTRALLEGRTVGRAALDPVADFTNGLRIGAAWLTLTHPTGTITWHNGGTGGFSTWTGLDRIVGRAVVVLSATSDPDTVDAVGFRLLLGQASWAQ